MTHTRVIHYRVGSLQISARAMTGRMEHYFSVRIRGPQGEELENYMLVDSELEHHAKSKGWVRSR